jgi:hypothetical protein
LTAVGRVSDPVGVRADRGLVERVTRGVQARRQGDAERRGPAYREPVDRVQKLGDRGKPEHPIGVRQRRLVDGSDGPAVSAWWSARDSCLFSNPVCLPNWLCRIGPRASSARIAMIPRRENRSTAALR